MTEEEFASYIIEALRKSESSVAMIMTDRQRGVVHINGSFDMNVLAASMLEHLRVDAISVLPNGRHMLRINDSWFDGPEVAL